MAKMQCKSNDLGFSAPSACRFWNPTAIQCFNRGCVCRDCYYDDFFKNAPGYSHKAKCQMKATVIELVRQFGIPQGIKTKGVIDE